MVDPIPDADAGPGAVAAKPARKRLTRRELARRA